MIYVGIDVAKEKHDCCITDSVGEILAEPFTITNTKDGFLSLYDRIRKAGGRLHTGGECEQACRVTSREGHIQEL